MLEGWRGFLGDDGTRVRQLPKNGIEYYFPRALLTKITGICESDLEAAIADYLESMKNSKEATLGSFTGSKRQLAATVATQMQKADVDNVDAEIVSMIAAVRDNRFSARKLN